MFGMTSPSPEDAKAYVKTPFEFVTSGERHLVYKMGRFLSRSQLKQLTKHKVSGFDIGQVPTSMTCPPPHFKWYGRTGTTKKCLLVVSIAFDWNYKGIYSPIALSYLPEYPKPFAFNVCGVLASSPGAKTTLKIPTSLDPDHPILVTTHGAGSHYCNYPNEPFQEIKSGYGIVAMPSAVKTISFFSPSGLALLVYGKTKVK